MHGVQPKPKASPRRSKGGKQATRKTCTSLKHSAMQRDVIREQVTRRNVTPSELDVTMGEDVPATVVLQRFPDTLYEEIPEIQDYEFFITNEDVVVDRAHDKLSRSSSRS
jgi:hypothetical protein